jgi:hypothetical protein
MRLVIKYSIQLCLRTLVFSIVLRHSNYNNRIISIEGTFLGHPVQGESKKSDDCDMYNRNVIPCGV